MTTERTHDALYLNEDYKSNPKEYFKLTKEEIKNDFGMSALTNDISLLDIGCETGSFLHYLRSEFPNINLSGMDVMKDLLEKVNDGIKNNDSLINTICADISDIKTLPEEKFNIITMLGVLSIFDDYKSILDNVISMLKNNGRLYLFSIFNPEEWDVLVKCRKANHEGAWESGWNCFSLKSIEHYCEENGLETCIIPFNIPFPIARHEDDSLRSWTEELKEGYMIINGTQIRHNFYLIKIQKNRYDSCR